MTLIAFGLSASPNLLSIANANSWYSTVAAGKPTASKASAAGGAKETGAAGAGNIYSQDIAVPG